MPVATNCLLVPLAMLLSLAGLSHYLGVWTGDLRLEPEVGLDRYSAHDASFKLWWARLERLSGSPGAILAFLRAQREADVRHVLPAIRVPTLILQRNDDAYRNPGALAG